MSKEHKRMCSCCREMKEKDELFRIVLVKGSNPVLDLSYKIQGRGAYICKDSECIKNGLKRRSLERSLSHSVNIKIYDENLLDFIECYFIQKYKPIYNETFNKGDKIAYEKDFCGCFCFYFRLSYGRFTGFRRWCNSFSGG